MWLAAGVDMPNMPIDSAGVKIDGGDKRLCDEDRDAK